MSDKNNVDEIINKMKAFSEEFKKNLIPVVNSNLAYISKEMLKSVVDRYYIDANFLKTKFKATKATTNNFALIQVRSKVLGLEYFRVTKNGRYLATGVRRDLGVKEHRDFFFFMNGTIFRRYGKKKNEIRRMYGPSVAGMVDNNELPENAAFMFYNLLQKDIEKIIEDGLND